MASQICEEGLLSGAVPSQSQDNHLKQDCDEEAQQLLLRQVGEKSQLCRRVLLFSCIMVGCVLVREGMARWTGQGDVVTTSDLSDLGMKAEISYSGCELQCAAKGRDYQYKVVTGKPSCICTDKAAVPLRKALDLDIAKAGNKVTSSNNETARYFPASQAFDGKNDTTWNGCCSGWPNQWLGYEFPSVERVDGYSFVTAEAECPVSWTFQGSNDGNSWSILDNRTLNATHACHPGSAAQYLVSAPGNHTHYKWQFSQGTPGKGVNGYRIREVDMFEHGHSLLRRATKQLPALSSLPAPAHLNGGSGVVASSNNDLGLALGLGLGLGIPVLATGLGVGLGVGLGAASASASSLGAAAPSLRAAPAPEGILGAMPPLWSGHVTDCLERCGNQTGFCSFCGQSQACCSRNASHASSTREPKECWDIPLEHFSSVHYQCVNPKHMVSSSEAGAAAAAAARDAGKSAQEQIAAAALAASNAEIMTFSETEAAAQRAALAAATEAGLSSDEVPAGAGLVAAKDAGPLLEVGGDCYEACGKKSGYCNFCGKGNACCRYGWQTVDGCRGVVSYSVHKHECVWPGRNATQTAN
eukprot:TRINITY_DN102854_c0_g1_i1.p1 TRINITY_DN102854_c0_g1~~TRINITY_DN102854_c0_g1_i1.p1  ORF type:complete len:584 (-),score=102.03 TRINITY_DN102854_c0_g1_i1:58-1809(-)